ncbi:hypothetical protein [Streptomyces sp. NPDC002690]
MGTPGATEARAKYRGLRRRAAVVAVAAGVAACVVAAGSASGQKGSSDGADRVASLVADEAPGYAVEDFGYPGAERILAETGITLKRGDGHIVLADCAAGGNLVKVRSSSQPAGVNICFLVTGNGGWLSLEIPTAFSVWGAGDYTTTVSLTTDSDEQSWTATKNQWLGVGRSVDASQDWTLVEIRASK